MANNYTLFGIIRATIKRSDVWFALRRLSELLYGYPLYLFSFITPRQKNKWLFGTNVGFTDNAKYLFIYTNEQKDDIRPIWITPNKKDVEQIRTIGMEAYRKYSFKGLYHCLTASVYIFTYRSKDINFFTSGNAHKVNLWHGVGIKGGNGGKKTIQASSNNIKIFQKILLPHMYEKISLFLSTSDMMDKHFINMFRLDEKVIVNSIYPRCYYMCKPQDEIHFFAEHYEPLSVRKIIDQIKSFDSSYLYMPTWRNDLKDNFIKDAGFDFEELNTCLKRKNAVFIFKLHPAVKIVHNEIHGYSNIIFLDKDIDVYPILPFIKTLITDYSSIYYDYILLNRNILLFPFDKQNYMNNSDCLAFDYDEFTPGCQIYTIRELLSAIASNEEFKVKDRNRIINAFWGKSDLHDLSHLYSTIKSL